MSSNPWADRVKGLLGIDSDDTLDDSVFFDDGSFTESEPSTKDWLLGLLPTGAGIVRYLRELFPFIGWIFHYNLTWLLGDIIAGGFSQSLLPSRDAHAQC